MNDTKVETRTEEQNLNEILLVRREKLEKLRQEGKDPFDITRYDVTHKARQIIDDFDNMEGQKVSIAGRIITRRIMGKASFAHILDSSGQIQIFVQINEVGDEQYQSFRSYDIGDIIGLTGVVFRTRMGEITVKVQEMVLLAKSLHPLPEKWHGLKDPDLRYRHRYTDLIVNPDVRRTFEIRSKIIRGIRNYLDERGYLEVETPILHTTAGGATARPFITHHNTLDIDMYLRIATELHLKRLIIGGLTKYMK